MIYKANAKLERWIENTWLSCHQRWVYAYREEKFNIKLNTNNGTESQNKLFKRIYLPRAAGKTLSSIASIIVNDFLPDQYRKYIINNIKMNAAHKHYNKGIPAFLHGRPNKFVRHCLTRISNADDDLEGHVISQDLQKMEFKVLSSNGQHQYLVQIGKPHCACPDWKRFKFPCKHMFSIFNSVEGVDWYSLPSSYRSAPHISPDHDSLLNFQIPAHTTPTNSTTTTDATTTKGDLDLHDTTDTTVTASLPIKEKTSIKSLAVKARTSLKHLQDLTYLLKDKGALQKILIAVTSIENEVKEAIPDESGLMIRSSPQKTRKKQNKKETTTKGKEPLGLITLEN